MKQKRDSRKRFDRLPNVVPVASLSEQMDLTTLIRQIVREEVQSLRAINQEPANQEQSIEAIVREEVQETLASLTNPQDQWTEDEDSPEKGDYTRQSQGNRDLSPYLSPEKLMSGEFKITDQFVSIVGGLDTWFGTVEKDDPFSTPTEPVKDQPAAGDPKERIRLIIADQSPGPLLRVHPGVNQEFTTMDTITQTTSVRNQPWANNL